MKIGLIARCERGRGLAIQCLNFAQHVSVERVLLVRMPNPGAYERPEWYPNATQLPSLPGHTLDEEAVREWMDGLDVVFSVETPYDWSLPRWAREMGVKTVIQGNPEFVRHGQKDYAHHESPDCWWWPTSWRLAHLPPGRVIPVPMPDHENTAADPHEGPLKIFHVTGKRAMGDRNGTDIVIDALRALRQDVEVTMFGLDHSLPHIDQPRDLSLIVRNEGVEDRWEMYRGQHMLILPRRYGGLCLPALEAASRGCAVLMTSCEPNRELATVLVNAGVQRILRVAAGQIESHDLNHMDLASLVNHYAEHRDDLAQAMQRSWETVPRWSKWKDIYMQEFARLL